MTQIIEQKKEENGKLVLALFTNQVAQIKWINFRCWFWLPEIR